MAWTERYVRADANGSGDGTTDANSGATGSWTIAQGVTNEAAGMRLNVKAGTYANTTTTRTLAAVGTTTAPIWWRGYNTTIGDIDTDNSLAKPEWTFTTGRVVISGAHHLFSNLNITCTGAVTNPALQISGGTGWLHRLRVDHQQANAASSALSTSTAGGVVVTSCYFKATASATRVVQLSVGTELSGCYVLGGIAGVDITSSIPTIRNVIVDSPTTTGVILNSASAGGTRLTNLTVYGCITGVNLIQVVAGTSIIDCLFHTLTTAITNTSGADTNFVRRLHNAYYSCGTTETGFGDSPAVGEVTESSDPLTDAAGHDFTLLAGASSRGSGTPGNFENTSNTSYLDRGAMQRPEGAVARALVFTRASTY